MGKADEKQKPKPKKLTQKEQSERFRQTARELECDESGDALERAFAKIVSPKMPKEEQQSWPPRRS